MADGDVVADLDMKPSRLPDDMDPDELNFPSTLRFTVAGEVDVDVDQKRGLTSSPA